MKQVINDIYAGANHTVITVRNNQTNEKEIYSFGNEIGIVDEDPKHTHIPQKVSIKQLKSNDEIEQIYVRYNTSVVIDKKS